MLLNVVVNAWLAAASTVGSGLHLIGQGKAFMPSADAIASVNFNLWVAAYITAVEIKILNLRNANET